MNYWKDLAQRSRYEETWLTALFVFLIFIGILGLSFVGSAALFYLVTVILAECFSIVIPFTWTKALGVWLLVFLFKILVK